MKTDTEGSGRFSEVELHPEITITKDSDIQTAHALHDEAHRMCFIANSCNFPITCQPKIKRL